MRTLVMTTVLALGAVTAGIVPLPAPASAAPGDAPAVTLTITGTDGADQIVVTCVDGQVLHTGVAVEPPTACDAFDELVVEAGAGPDTVDLAGVTPAAGFVLTEFGTRTDLGMGSDQYVASEFPDQVVTGTGSDSVQAGEQVTVTLDGTDLVSGDTVRVLAASGPDVVDVADGALGASVLSRTAPSAATATVTASHLLLDLGAGDDTATLTGTPPHRVTVDGQGGADTLTALAGAATLLGGPGDDVLTGGPADDVLVGGEGADTLDGGDGADLLGARLRPPAPLDATDDPGDDTFVGGPGADHVVAGPGHDTTSGGPGDDRVEWEPGDIGAATDGGGGTDTFVLRPDGATTALRVRPAGSRFTVDLRTALGSTPITPTAVDALELEPVYSSAPAIDPSRASVEVTAMAVVPVVVGDFSTRVDVRVPRPARYRAAPTDGGVRVTAPGFAAVDTSTPLTRVHGSPAWPLTSFATNARIDLLGAAPTDSELADDVALLTSGPPRSLLVSRLQALPGYRDHVVRRAYLTFLTRDATSAFWADRLADGMAPDTLRASLIGSAEYWRRAGSTNDRWLTRAFTDILGRNPDAGATAFYVPRLDAGASRTAVALTLLRSAESRRRWTTATFARLLDRPSTVAERSAYALLLEVGVTEARIEAALVGSPEYVAGT